MAHLWLERCSVLYLTTGDAIKVRLRYRLFSYCWIALDINICHDWVHLTVADFIGAVPV